MRAGSDTGCEGSPGIPNPAGLKTISRVSAVVLQPAGRRGPSLGAAAGSAGGRLAALLGKRRLYTRQRLVRPLSRTMLTMSVTTVSGST